MTKLSSRAKLNVTTMRYICIFKLKFDLEANAVLKRLVIVKCKIFFEVPVSLGTEINKNLNEIEV